MLLSLPWAPQFSRPGSWQVVMVGQQKDVAFLSIFARSSKDMHTSVYNLLITPARRLGVEAIRLPEQAKVSGIAKNCLAHSRTCRRDAYFWRGVPFFALDCHSLLSLSLSIMFLNRVSRSLRVDLIHATPLLAPASIPQRCWMSSMTASRPIQSYDARAESADRK